MLFQHLRAHFFTPSIQRSPETWLQEYCNGLFWRLELHHVDDIYRAEAAAALWNSEYSIGHKIVSVDKDGKTNPHRRLHQALADHQRQLHGEENVQGRLFDKYECFTDVIICLPADKFKLDKMMGIAVLLHNLEWYHANSFRGKFSSGRSPRYAVLQDNSLANQQVAFWFGMGVYVPTPDEVPAFKISLSSDGVPIEPPQLKLRQPNLWLEKWRLKPLQRPLVDKPIGLYADQQYLLLTNDNTGLLTAPRPEGLDEAFLLVCQSGENAWEASSDGNGKASTTEHSNGDWHFERAPIEDTNGQTLSIKLAGSVNPAQFKRLIYQPKPLDDGSTSLPDDYASEAFGTNFTYILELDAAILPKLQEHLDGWSLWLDQKGVLATPEQVQSAHSDDALITLSCERSTGLALTIPGQPRSELGNRISTTISIGNTTALLRPPIHDLGLGILQFAAATPYPIDQDRKILGRTDPTTPTPATDVIILDQLAQPGGLHPAVGVALRLGETIGRIGYSRRHAWVWVDHKTGKLFSEPVDSKHTLLWRLDRQDRLTQYNPAQGPLQLQPGDALVAMNYLLRFKKYRAYTPTKTTEFVT